jgi:cytochrome c
MKRLLVVLSVCLFIVAVASPIAKASTENEAKGMVEKAIAYYKANGKEKAFQEISNKKGSFVKGELYVFVYDMSGKCVAHGFNEKLIGKDLIDMRDPDGKFYVKERIEIAKTKGKGWQDYKFTNPTSKKIENKTAYVEKADEFVFGCGTYKH